MSRQALEQLTGRAIVDLVFRNALLSGNREEAIAEFDLTERERSAVLNIEATTLQQFAQRLLEWLDAEEGRRQAHANATKNGPSWPRSEA